MIRFVLEEPRQNHRGQWEIVWAVESDGVFVTHGSSAHYSRVFLMHQAAKDADHAAQEYKRAVSVPVMQQVPEVRDRNYWLSLYTIRAEDALYQDKGGYWFSKVRVHRPDSAMVFSHDYKQEDYGRGRTSELAERQAYQVAQRLAEKDVVHWMKRVDAYQAEGRFIPGSRRWDNK